MAAAVATPLEYQFMQIPGVTQLTSQSVLGSTSITVQFDLNRDIDAAAQDIQAAIDAAAGQLPKNLPSPPHYRKENPADSPILIYAVHSDTLPLTTVDDYAENILVQQISQIPGVAPGLARRPAEAGHPRAGRSGEDGQHGDPARGCGERHPVGDRRLRQGRHQRHDPHLHDLRQRPARQAEAVERRDRRLPQRRTGADPRHRPGRARPGEYAGGGLPERQARRPAAGVQAAGRQRDRDRRRRVKASMPHAMASMPPGDQGGQNQRSHADHPRLGRTTWNTR